VIILFLLIPALIDICINRISKHFIYLRREKKRCYELHTKKDESDDLEGHDELD